MNPGLPIPTDNIYKFYALFGTVLFIACLIGSLSFLRRSNDDLHNLLVELDALESTRSTENQVFFQKYYKARIEALSTDRSAITKGLPIIGVMGLIVAICGYWKWHTVVQPLHTELLELQVKKLRADLAHEDDP